MKKLRILFALFLLPQVAMAAQKSRSQITNEITTQFPSNNAGQIKASDLRTVTQDINDSSVNRSGDTMTGQLNLPTLAVSGTSSFSGAMTIGSSQPFTFSPGALPSSPSEGACAWNNAIHALMCYNGSVWQQASGSSGGGSGLSSIGLSVPGGSLFGVTNSPLTANGTIGLTISGTSGGLPYFSSTSVLSSSSVMTANAPILGGGAGGSPVSGAKSSSGAGATNTFATTAGTLNSGNCAKFDNYANIVDAGAACGTGAGGGITIGTTGITSGTQTRVLYHDSSDHVGEYPITGSGNVVLSTSPTLVAPDLGTPHTVNLINATNIPLTAAVNNLPISNLNSGTGASSSTFWRGDGVWASPTVGSAPINPGSGTYTVSNSDAGGTILMSGGTVLLAGGLSNGAKVDIISTSSTTVTLAASGTTFHSFNSWTNLAGLYAGATCIYNSSTWYCSGALAP